MPLAFTFEEASALLKQLKSEHLCRRRIELEVTPTLKRTLGQTKRTGLRAYLIRLSSYLSYDEMQDTMRHEFAHIMAGLRKGHGEHWKEWARAVDATPERCAPRYPALTPLHNYACPSCDDQVIKTANRLRTKKWVCGRCKTPLEQFIYTYTQPTESDIPPRQKVWLRSGEIKPLPLYRSV